MTIEFFWTPGGPFALRCVMTLAVKKLTFLSRRLDLAKGENRTAAFLALNPSGTLPVLKDGDVVVRESQAIMFYLDRAYPAVPLYGETPGAAARIMQEICEQQSYVEPIVHPLMGPLLFGRPASRDDLEGGFHRLETLLSEVERRLASTGWLGGPTLSAADINLYPLLRSITDDAAVAWATERRLTPPAVSKFTSLQLWFERLRPLADAHGGGPAHD